MIVHFQRNFGKLFLFSLFFPLDRFYTFQHLSSTTIDKLIFPSGTFVCICSAAQRVATMKLFQYSHSKKSNIYTSFLIHAFSPVHRICLYIASLLRETKKILFVDV